MATSAVAPIALRTRLFCGPEVSISTMTAAAMTSTAYSGMPSIGRRNHCTAEK